jgi:RNA polymerase sigma-70 factor (ECF subfamily)
MSRTEGDAAQFAATPDEVRLVQALRGGDEAAFAELVERYHRGLMRLALLYVSSRAAAEDAVQETWLGVLRGLDRFEGRASLKTWIYRILVNRAKTRGEREARQIPFSSLGSPAIDDGPTVDPDRFRGPDDAQWPGHWAAGKAPQSWDDDPEARLLSSETLARIRQAVDRLPPNQREVITLRDVEGWSSEEVCHVLDISETNQRVLLHRARSKVRNALEEYFRGE